MRKPVLFLLLLVLCVSCLVPVALAQKKSEIYNPLPAHLPTKARFVVEFAGGSGGGSALVYHGGPVINSAHVVPIFWGPSWATGGGDNGIATSLTNYINAFGQTGEYNVITQYYDGSGNISLSALGAGTGGAIFDTSNPPQNVSDADVQAEVLKMVSSPQPDTVYEVFLPTTSYASSGTATSCGGPNLQFCAYHGNFSMSNGTDVKYASMPYPSCGGCQSFTSTTQNLEHFVSHETREAVTDEDLNAWYDRRGYEADDKCAWSPTPFADATTGTNQDGTGFAYQYEWSNAVGKCVKK